MSHEPAIEQLQAQIERLRVHFERFFNGDLERPPDQLRQEVQERIRSLRSANLQSAAEQFRLNSLEARFNTFTELFNRRLRQHEQGQLAAAGRRADRGAGYDPQAGVVVDESLPPEAVETLYAELHRQTDRELAADLDSFRQYLKDQVARIRQQTGCREVQFRIASKGGKLKLKAKPVTTPGGSGTDG